MAIRTHLTGTLNMSHLFMLEDATRDAGSNGEATTGAIAGADGDFLGTPICEGIASCLETNAVAGATSVANGFVIGNTGDTNTNPTYSQYVFGLWFNADDVSNPTCVYEQGGGTNNKALNVGLASAITSQSADAGEPFLLAQSQFQAQAGRSYLAHHNWIRHDQHAGSGNKIQLIINGVQQQEIELTGTANFPNHSGDICVGNSNDTLQSYNGSTQRYVARAKRCALFHIGSGFALTVAECREIFERTVIPTITIAADTVVNQQAALDALSGNSYAGENCQIRIVQATDATDYRLFVDNISFAEDANLRDISIQYLGPNTLTLENANGSNVVEVSTPIEVELVGSTLVGGGVITLVENTVRVNALADQSNVIATKIVIEQAGSYNFTNVQVSELENVSGGAVTIISDTAIPLVTDTNGTTTLINGALDFSDAGDWTVYPTEADRDNNTSAIQSGTTSQTYNFQFSAGTTYWLRIVRGGVAFLMESTPSTAGTTAVVLSAEALLASLTAESIADAVWDEARADHVTAGTTGAALKVINDGVQNASLLIPHTADVD